MAFRDIVCLNFKACCVSLALGTSSPACCILAAFCLRDGRCACLVDTLNPFLRRKAISGQECSLLDIDWALEEGQGRVLVPGLKVQGGDLPDAYVQSLKAPFWLQDPEVRLRMSSPYRLHCVVSA